MNKISLAVQIDGKEHSLKLSQTAEAWECILDGRVVTVDAAIIGRDLLSLRIDGRVHEIRRTVAVAGTVLWVGNTPYAAEWSDPRSLRGRKRSAGDADAPKSLVAPMPGKVIRLLLKENAEVEAGESILVMEAMKMQNEIKSPKKGRVRKIMASEGTNVNAGDVLAIVE